MRALAFAFLSPLFLVACVTSEATPSDGGADLGVVDGGAGDGPVADGGRPPTCADLMPIDMGLAFGGGPGDGLDGGLATDLGFLLTVGLEDTTTGGVVATPWHDSDTVELVHGLQGGWMVTPSLDVDTTAEVPTTAEGYACFDVFITNAAPGAPGLSPMYAAGTLAPPVAGRPHVFHVPLQQDFLDYDPTEVDGKALSLGFHLVGPTGEGRTMLTVTPRTITTGMP